MNEQYKLLVFDWDGTLMDSEARIVDCLRGAIEDLGLEGRDEAALRNIIGLGLRESIRSLYPEADDALCTAFTRRYRYHFLEGCTTPSTLFPGTRELLEELHGQGYLLGVATGKGRSGLDRALAETGLERFFHATRCADETASKPHPRMLLELMDTLSAAPQQTLMVGDTEYDMQMAARAGADAVAVTYGVHERERLLAAGPLRCVDTVADLHACLCRVPARPAAIR